MQRLMTLFAMLVLVVMTGRAGTPQAASRNSHDLGVYDGAASGGEWRTERADAAGGGAMMLALIIPGVGMRRQSSDLPPVEWPLWDIG